MWCYEGTAQHHNIFDGAPDRTVPESLFFCTSYCALPAVRSFNQSKPSRSREADEALRQRMGHCERRTEQFFPIDSAVPDLRLAPFGPAFFCNVLSGKVDAPSIPASVCP